VSIRSNLKAALNNSGGLEAFAILCQHALNDCTGGVIATAEHHNGGVSLWEMMDYVKAKKITVQYDLEDFQRDLKTVAASERR